MQTATSGFQADDYVCHRVRGRRGDVSNCTFVGNVVTGPGAGLFQEATPGSLTRCSLANNKAEVRVTCLSSRLSPCHANL
jgi:hypothetical protein